MTNEAFHKDTEIVSLAKHRTIIPVLQHHDTRPQPTSPWATPELRLSLHTGRVPGLRTTDVTTAFTLPTACFHLSFGSLSSLRFRARSIFTQPYELGNASYTISTRTSPIKTRTCSKSNNISYVYPRYNRCRPKPQAQTPFAANFLSRPDSPAHPH